MIKAISLTGWLVPLLLSLYSREEIYYPGLENIDDVYMQLPVFLGLIASVLWLYSAPSTKTKILITPLLLLYATIAIYDIRMWYVLYVLLQ